ncbi:MAG TPA: hypothetical protein VF066_03095 [Thermoleophilaceae bacterium]
MERRGANTWIVAVLAIAVGFLAALLIMNGDDDNTSTTVATTSSATTQAGTITGTDTNATGTTTTSTTSTQQAAPQEPAPSVQSCVNLWNQQNNRANQTFLVNIMSQQPVRVHAGVTGDVPPQCLMTIVTNDGKAYVFPEGGGATFPYAVAPGSADAGSLPAAQKTSNALEERDGTLKAR